jgi:hypothetical protein
MKHLSMRMRKTIINCQLSIVNCLLLFILSTASMNAQVLIGGSIEDEPRPGALLDLKSGSHGLLLPQVELENTAEFQLSDSPEEGMMIYNISEITAGGSGKGVYVWKNSEWKLLTNGPVYVPVSGIAILVEEEVDYVNTGSTLQLIPVVTPSNATNPSVTWSVVPVLGSGSVSADGVFTGHNPGTVTVRATANDGTGVKGEIQLTVNAPGILVDEVTVTSAGDARTLVAGSTLQLFADAQPATATNRTVTWSISEGTAASVNPFTGQVTGTGLGEVTVRATANDGSGEYDEITLSVTMPLVTAFTISGENVIPKLGSTTLVAEDFVPAKADHTVEWSIQSGENCGAITGYNATSCVVTATTTAGTVIVKATSRDGNTILTYPVTVRQPTPCTGFTMSGINYAYAESTFSVSDFVPAEAEEREVTFNIISGGGIIESQNGTSCVVNANGSTGYTVFSASTVSGITRKDTILFVATPPAYGEDLVTANATYPTYDFGAPVGTWTLKNMVEPGGTANYPDHLENERGRYYTGYSCPTGWALPDATASRYLAFVARRGDASMRSTALPVQTLGGWREGGTDWSAWGETAGLNGGTGGSTGYDKLFITASGVVESRQVPAWSQATVRCFHQ